MSKAVIYCRVSTEEQAKHGYSLGQQKKECIEFAVKSGYEVDKIFVEEGESAKNLIRTQLKNMFAYCSENLVLFFHIFFAIHNGLCLV